MKSGVNNSIYNSTAYFYTFLDGIYTVMARTTKPLTTAEINNAKPKGKLYRLYDGNGLVLNITPTGSKAWYLQYKHPITTKAQMYKLGDYPALSLADARDRVMSCQSLLANNIDPKAHDERQKQAKLNAIRNDFKSVFSNWLDTMDYSDGTLRKMENYKNELIAVLGNKPISEISVPDLIAVLKPVEGAGHFAKLEKMRTMLNKTFSYAIATGLIQTNPAINLRGVFKTGDVKHNPAILDEARLAELIQCIDGYHGNFTTKKALLFALLTFARPGEVRHITWNDIKDGNWEYIPNKTRKSTAVKMLNPLPTQALEILEQMKAFRSSEFIFPSVTSNVRPLSENTLNQALRRMGFDNTEQTSHGFRAIARTLLEERFGYDYRMIELQLGHQVRDSNGRAYNRVQWLEKRREMMQAWADYLESLLDK